MASAAEKEIRDATVQRLRQLRPEARIIHELRVFAEGRRTDLACIGENEIILVEIKSERDKLDRLEPQVKAFRKNAHHVVTVLHEKFIKRGYRDATQWSAAYSFVDVPTVGPIFFGFGQSALWIYPSLPISNQLHHEADEWSLPKRNYVEMPTAHDLLELTWGDEQKEIADRLGISLKGTSTKIERSRRIARFATGEQITRQVCTMLRTRKFAEADPPVE